METDGDNTSFDKETPSDSTCDEDDDVIPCDVEMPGQLGLQKRVALARSLKGVIKEVSIVIKHTYTNGAMSAVIYDDRFKAH